MTKEKKGEFIILSQAVLWSLFPVITSLSIRKIPPILSLAWSTSFAAVFFGLSLSIKNQWKQILRKEVLGDILLTTLFIGVLYYLLFFIGLRHTSAGNAGLIALTEIFFSFLIFHVWRKDFIPPAHIAGAALMSGGALIVLCPNVTHFHAGDLLILIAAFVAPIGNHFQKKARQKVGSESILFIRCLISAPAMFLLAFFMHSRPETADLKKSMIYFALNGFFLLGLSKFLWVEGIHRISITKASALGGMAPLLTLLFAWLLLRNTPTAFQLFAFIPMFSGMLLLGKNEKRNSIESCS